MMDGMMNMGGAMGWGMMLVGLLVLVLVLVLELVLDTIALAKASHAGRGRPGGRARTGTPHAGPRGAPA